MIEHLHETNPHAPFRDFVLQSFENSKLILGAGVDSDLVIDSQSTARFGIGFEDAVPEPNLEKFFRLLLLLQTTIKANQNQSGLQKASPPCIRYFSGL